ncbi:pilus assembly PilX family protein [Massilia niastensis]|uniref:pilus assembly PilX family protein n=1 Tax=Massilia niastensis TaxID=544911 RepID=UPI00036611F4|nr:pilus assembly PilX N-terminal domain-containing protein [Massilia niastensis]
MSRFPLPHPRRSAGVGLVTAIFLLVVLAGLGVAAVTIFNAQQAGASNDFEGAKAYQAARAGIEWGLYERLRAGRCGDGSFALPPDSVLANFTVSVHCEAIAGPVTEDGDEDALTRWRIKATACNQPVDDQCGKQASNSPDFVQRRLEVEI